MDIETIVVRHSIQQRYIFDVDDEPEMMNDPTETYLIWTHLEFEGVPATLSDSEHDHLYDGDKDESIPFIKIASVLGCLILCAQMLDDGYEPLDICDAAHGDLEYTLSALQEPGGPLDEDSINPFQNIFYIDDFEMEKEFQDENLKSRILNELPHLIKEFYHNTPHILAHYPSPTERPAKSGEEQERELAISGIVAKRIDDHFSEYVEPEPQPENSSIPDGENIVPFPDRYQLSDDDVKRFMGRRIDGSEGYPEQLKDKNLIRFYLDNGFCEAGKSRLLYKQIDWD